MKSTSFSILLLIAVVAGCDPASTRPKSPKESGGSADKRKLRIAVIPKGTTHEFWKSVHFGAEKAGKELDAEILWQGPLLESDRDGQITVVQNFVTKRVDGICLAPLDSQALVPAVREAKQAGVPVVIFDSGLDDADSIVSYVATDNLHGGALAAEEMAKRLNGQGNVILLRYTSGSDSTHQREEGFLKKLGEYPNIKVISSDQYAGTTEPSAIEKAQQLLTKYRQDVNGIFAVCEPNAQGVLEALKGLELAGKVVFVGFDPSERMVQALADNEMKGIVLQDPVQMGYLAAKTMIEHLRGREVERLIGTGESIATPENMLEPAIDKLLHPPQFQ